MKHSVLILIVALQMGSATAGTYTFSDMPENEGAPRIAICQDFMENLKRLGNPPMVCDRKFDPTMKQFTWPRWKPIDALKHRDLVEQIWQHEFGWAYDEASSRVQNHLLLAQDTRQAHARLKASLAEKVRSGDLNLAITQISIAGTPTTVLRLHDGDKGLPCKTEDWQSTYPLRQFFVVDRGLQRVDFEATDESVLRGFHDYADHMRPDLFLYRGKPHIAFWYPNGKGRGHIEVFGDYSNYCYIDFTSTPQGEKQ